MESEPPNKEPESKESEDKEPENKEVESKKSDNKEAESKQSDNKEPENKKTESKETENEEEEVVEETEQLSRFEKIKKILLSTKTLIYSSISFALLFVIVIIFQSCTPRQGNILYGMCLSFLELQLPFPETIEPKEIEFYRAGTRIYYTHLDGFGEYRLETIECTFRQDPDKGVQLENAYFNYVKPSTYKKRIQGKGRQYAVRDDVIQLFNDSRSPAAILEAIDLSIPDDTVIRAY